jgi:hypothetical protein
MPKLLENTLPSYRLHKQSGQAIVTLNSRDILLGTYGSAESRQEYRRRIAQWIANGRQLSDDNTDFSVSELIQRFKEHAEHYYRHPDGRPTDEMNCLRLALRPLRILFGASLASEFGPLALRTVCQDMIRRGWCRTSINRHLGRIKHLFK